MILVSACLAGFRCRYDGKTVPDEETVQLVRSGQAVPVCPEMMGGLPCPRIPCERTPNGRVTGKDGTDKTDAFVQGAKETLRIARLYDCNCAILKARSPSCGKGLIYDGSFTGTLTEGEGVAAELLEQNGITILVKQ
jgi:Uncharacterized conserved protein